MVGKKNKKSVNGKIHYGNKTYRVLNAPLEKKIVKKLENYKGEKKWHNALSPWKTMQLSWKIEENKLYLEKLYTNGLLEELTGSNKIFASWINELQLLVDDKTICKTYEQKNSFLKEQTILYLYFDNGVLIKEEKEEELYTEIDINDELDRYPTYATFCMDSNDLLIYLEDDAMQDSEDQLLPLFSTFIDRMLDENYDGITLDKSDLKEVLLRGDVVYFSFVHGKKEHMENIIASLISSVTNENILNPKGCLLSLTVNQKYPRKSIISMIEEIDVGLKFDYEPLEPDLKEPFYVGTRYMNGMKEDEISIMILVSI